MNKLLMLILILSITISAAFAVTNSPEVILEDRCKGCHDLDVVRNADKTKPEWEHTIDKMINNGARVNQEERKILINYLSTQGKKD
jgi:hypothetical protein